MLSRVANTLYWMIRCVERADNLARLIDVNQQLLLDHESLDSTRLRAFWMPIVLSTGDEELFNELYETSGSNEVIRFLTDDQRNPNSICSCIGQAREGARTVRDQLSDELWEELNALYLFTCSDEAARLIENDPQKYYENVRRSVVTFHGIAASTMSRNEAWEFMDLGRYLERADKTTRFLDISTYLPEGTDGAALLHWTAILRTCGAVGAFRAEHREFEPSAVVDFLLFSRAFPRSVRYCLERVDISLHRISGTERGGFSTEAEKLAGRLLARLNFGSPVDAFDGGLHDYLDDLQGRFNDIGAAIFETYVLMPERIQRHAQEANITAVARWQMEQQQQQ